MTSAHKGESLGFDQLLLCLHRSAGAAGENGEPWREFLDALCAQLQAGAAALVLQQRGRGDVFTGGGDAALEALLRLPPATDDPFANLENGSACNLDDRIERNALARTEFYRSVLQRDAGIDLLALSIEGRGALGAQLRILRRQSFGVLEKSLLMRLYPHVQAALAAFENLRRLRLENNAYQHAIDQLAFGVIIINGRGQVVRVNETASVIMKESRLLRVVGNYLHAAEPEGEVLIAKTVKALLEDAAQPGKSLKIESRRTDKSLYLLFKPIAGGDAQPAGIALYLSHDNLQRSISIETFAKLYQLTRAEVVLVTELLDGASIVEASANLGISENTARAQLRSVFTKTGTHRQTDLIRLALTSLAIIA